MLLKQRGQVGLMILVVMGVLVSLSLSVASRSLSDLVLSRQESENTEVFHTAEQGVEEALNAIRQNSGLVDGGTYTGAVGSGGGLVTGQYSVDGFDGLDIFVKEGEVAEIDLTGYTSTSIDLYWTLKDDTGEDVTCTGEGSGNAPAAIEVVQSLTATDPVQRTYYNASNCDLNSSNGFALSSIDVANIFRSKITISPLAANVTKIRIRPIYNGATLGVEGLDLPSQLYVIRSAAEGGDAQKEIEVKRTNNQPVSIFDFALFTGGTIVK